MAFMVSLFLTPEGEIPNKDLRIIKSQVLKKGNSRDNYIGDMWKSLQIEVLICSEQLDVNSTPSYRNTSYARQSWKAS